MFNDVSWLSLTPEPERELPAAVATLAHGGPPPRMSISAEELKVERLVLRGSERRWFAYLRDVRELIQRTGASDDPEVQRARRRAAAVLSNHHNLLLGLPGDAARRTARERVILAELTAHISRNPTFEEQHDN
jgi:hypothetical protein